MKELENVNNQELDDKISLAMDKIVQDTIGHISIPEKIQSGNTKKNVPENKGQKSNNQNNNKKSKNSKKNNSKQSNKKQQEKNLEPKEIVKKGDNGSNSKEQSKMLNMPAVQAKIPSKPEDDKLKKKSLLQKVLLILAVVFLLSGLGVYGGFAYYYRDKFIPGTKINNIDAQEFTADEAEVLIKNKVESYKVKVLFREDKSQKIKGSDIEYEYVPDDSIKKILKDQNSLTWLFGYFKGSTYEVAENITYNEAKLNEQFSALDCLQADAQVAPVNAFVNYQNGQFEIVGEVEGTTIDSDVFLAVVKEAISKGQKQVSAEEMGAYKQPEIRSDNEALHTEQDELNELVNASITYQVPNGEEVLDGNTLRTWLLVDEQGHYTKDEAIFKERLIEYVASLAQRTDTVGAERPFTITGGGEITVSGGSYGWKINQNEEIATLAQNLANNEQLAREPIYTTREVTTENSGFGNTYIELNLTDQRLYYYQDGEIIVETDCVSGRMTKSRYTPPGIFTMYYKTKDRILRGDRREDGTYSYESHVNFWMPFNSGIGLHDASWRGSYGGTIYKYSGSHGCINLPYAKAQAIYENITKEVPIICFYTDGYSFI